MALKNWYETFSEGDCVKDHLTWNQMVDYIKHSSCCTFTIYSTCTATDVAFEFKTDNDIWFDEDRGIKIDVDETYLGHGAGDGITIGTHNTLMGYDAMNTLTTGGYNVAVGERAGDNCAVDIDNCVFIGGEAGENCAASNSVAIGFRALDAGASGADLVAVGYGALTANTTGYSNTAMGSTALGAVTTGDGNVGIGTDTGRNTNIGNYNMFIGYQAGYDNTEGNYNVAIGRKALYDNIDTNFNVAIGSSAGENAENTGCVYIGNQAGRDNATDNVLFINNSLSAFPLIWGDFANDEVKFGNNSDDWNFQFSHDGTYSIIEGGTNTADHLKLKANSADANPYIYISGSGWISYVAQDIANGVHDFFRGADDRAARITHDGTSVAQWTGGTRNDETLVITCNSGNGNGNISLITGTGVVVFGTYAAKGAEAFAGYVTINDQGGTPRKVMVCA